MIPRIVLTLAEDAFPDLERALGFPVERHPLVWFESPNDWAELDLVLRQRAGYGAVVLTSPRGAAAVRRRWAARDDQTDPWRGPGVWAIGPGTRRALGPGFGRVRVGGAAGQTTAVAVARRLVAAKIDSPVLAPGARVRRPELREHLNAHGIVVDQVEVYHTMLGDPTQIDRLDQAAAVVVGSPAVARLFIRSYRHAGVRPNVIAIGPTTGTAFQSHDWNPIAVLGRTTSADLVRALTAAGAGSPRP